MPSKRKTLQADLIDAPTFDLSNGKLRAIKMPDWAKKAAKAAPKLSQVQAKPFSIATAERHLQIIAKWERLSYITPAKAKQLRDRVLEEINL
jgi:hypothetical protein